MSALGAQQRLLVSRRQLLALGAGLGSINYALARGRLHRFDAGVYALVEEIALPPLAAEQAAVLVCGPDMVISHRSAAAVWGLAEPSAGPVGVTVFGRAAGRARSWIHCHRTRALDPADIRHRAGLPVTAPARTVIDFAAESSAREAELALDRALAARLTSRTAIQEAIARAPRRAGVATIRPLLDPGRGSTATASPPEALLLELVRRGGLPEPEINVSLGDPGSASALDRYRPDLLWREQRVVVEFDSGQHHSGRHAFEGDRRRDAEMIAAGWTVIRITWTELIEQPERVLVWIATALARRTAAAA
ncbi:MAG TPA: DUF559 domain-containing protein [Solirubrobacteraceae bacterium]|nr:DUF559 domain-containing protein [Solirubrobacteraceae bacterium]